MKFRHNVAIPLTGLAATIALIPLLGVRWYLMPFLLVPALVMVWGWRSGVDATPDGLTVRALLANRRLDWSEVTGFGTQGRRVYAVLPRDRVVALPAVEPKDVPLLLEAGGQQLAEQPEAKQPDPEQPDAEQPDAEQREAEPETRPEAQ